MTRSVRNSLLGSSILVAIVALAGCSHYMMAEREPWRRDAEAACLDSSGVKESPSRVRISSIDGPGACGISYPLKVSSLGDSAIPLGYDDEPMTPPGSIPQARAPNASMPQHWPIAPQGSVQSNSLPPPQSSPSMYGGATAGAPLSIRAPGIPDPAEEDAAEPGAQSYPPNYSARPPTEPVPPLGPAREPVLAAGGPVELKPTATLACPIVSALDQWINNAVQPTAERWFHQSVVEIKQISAYSCRGMNGNPNAHISEHAFGNALDVAEFTLADGHKISVQYGWHGTPEEQAFLHDVQSAACQQFTTVLAPGANVYHYNHIHVDLMRHYNSRHICEPAAISGQVAFDRARAQYAAKHGDPGITGALGAKIRHILGYTEDDKHPNATPGDD